MGTNAEVERIDRLNELISEIEAINYINILVQDDTVDGLREGLSWTQQSAIYFITERYSDAVSRLRKYVNSDSFNHPDETDDN